MGSSGSKNNHKEEYYSVEKKDKNTNENKKEKYNSNLRDYPTDLLNPEINKNTNNNYINNIININKDDNNKEINIIKINNSLEINKNDVKIEMYKVKALQKHNELRKLHGSEDLKINNELNKMAQEKAHNLIEDQSQNFSNHLYKGEALGENILISNDLQIKPEEICEEWYKENEKYNYELNKFQKGKGHFTQLVWRSSKEVGFGFEFTDNKVISVAYYYPAGNIVGEFDKNIKEIVKNKE